MILTRSLLRTLRRAGRLPVLAVIFTVIAFGLWHFTLSSLTSGDSSSGSVARATGSPQIIYSEFGQNADTIWTAPGEDLSRRTALATVDHAPDYGIFPSLSPDGRRIAYTVLAPDSGLADVSAPAEVWVMDGDGGNRRRIAVGADLPVIPVWAPDSASLVFRRSVPRENAAGAFQLVRITLRGVETVLLDTNLGVFPVGFSPDEATFYFVQLSPSGTDLGRMATAGGPATVVAHLSDDFARDWHLSLDGTRLAFLAPRNTGDRVSYSASVLDLAGGGVSVMMAASAVTAAAGADEFNPIWHPNGRDLTVGRLTSGRTGAPALQMAAEGVGAERSLAAPAQGFDVPLSWSLDGRYLAVRFFEGSSVTNPGRSWVMVIDGGSKRQTVSPSSDIEVLGWRGGGG
jgi:Tol biopolymer transport system component